VTRRILTIIVAIVLAVIGTTAVLIYVRQADQRALAGQKAVTVLVATQQIPAGTTARTAMTNGWLSGQKFPASSVPSGALSSLTSSVAGLVFTSDLPAGQLLTRPILGAAVTSSSSLPVPAGMVAVSFQFCVPNAVAGYVLAGSHIAVFNTFLTGGAKSGTSGNCSPANLKLSQTQARLVLNNVLVVAVGPAPAAPTAGGATSTSFSQNNNNASGSGPVLVTMALSQADAERMIELAQAGIPYLALETASSKASPDRTLKP
jgi:pilus assembly protein CpaB